MLNVWNDHIVPGFWKGVHIVFGGWGTTSELLEDVLNDSPPDFTMVLKWKEQKNQELNFVGLTAALIAGVTAAALTWPSIENAPAATPALWYSSLIFSVVSILSAMQQGNLLYKLTSRSNGLARLQSLLRSDRRIGEKWQESRGQHFVWQTPLMLLNFSFWLFLIGLMIVVFNAAVVSKEGLDGREVKIAFVFGFAATFSIGSFLFSMVNLYKEADGMQMARL
ncbi:hypothetical protein BDZ45DRAFT_748983 [Acephala macrosclerotiorum]|nr:hypothetical protein BDZ45DRAFT_748983 [Acephala macrosclerotiorum]